MRRLYSALLISIVLLNAIFASPLDINKVSKQDLIEHLPNLDVEIIDAIISYRNHYGQFQSINNLLKIDEISDDTFIYLSKHLQVPPSKSKPTRSKNEAEDSEQLDKQERNFLDINRQKIRISMSKR